MVIILKTNHTHGKATQALLITRYPVILTGYTLSHTWQKAIKKGTGELEGGNLEEIFFSVTNEEESEP